MKNRSGFTLIELMVVVIVISIIASIVALAYDKQMRVARDSKAEISLVNLTQALDRHYEQTGSYPVTCDQNSNSPVLRCSFLSTTYNLGKNAPPSITPSTTSAEIASILPMLGDSFNHPTKPEGAPINRTVSNTIQSDSFFLLSMDLTPGGYDGGYQCIPGQCEGGGTGPVVNNSNIRLASVNHSVMTTPASLALSLPGITTPIGGYVRLASPTNDNTLACYFSLTGMNQSGNKNIRPHQYLVGYYSYEVESWRIYMQSPRSDLNVVDWNTQNTAACEAESIGALKS